MFEKILIKALKVQINCLEDELKEKKEELKREKEKNKIYQKDMVIILENSAEQRRKIKDLENNIEFLYNNLSAQKKKLFRAEN